MGTSIFCAGRCYSTAGNSTCSLSVGMYEDLKEYLNWYDTRRDVKFAADAPVVGLVLQRSHLVTGDEGHYSGVVSELEAQGAKVLPLLPLLSPLCCLPTRNCRQKFRLDLPDALWCR